MKRYLMTPGPTPVPEKIALAMAAPIIHHRTKEYIDLHEKVREKLKKIFQTQNDIVIFASSGTGAMEASVSNILSENDKALVVEAGKFGERFSQLVSSFGAQAIILKKEYGDFANAQEIEDYVKKYSPKAVYMQACETSTGVFHPIDEIGKMLKEKYPEVVFVVDGITAVGCIDIKTDEWGIDILLTGSQKAFMLPPGLAMLSISEKAKKIAAQNKNKRYYFDILGELNAQTGHFTPAVTLVLGLNAAVDMMLEEGLGNVFKRHEFLAKAVKAAILAMDLELFAKRPSNSLTAVKAPQSIDSKQIIDIMNKFGVSISNGQGSMKGKIFRIAHLGYFYPPDVILTIGTLEIALKKLGIDKLGVGTKKALEIFVEY
ncbi:aspartate aminotransferase [Desulfurella multipotens]|uniref:Aspartate aminotransferase n=1 Tax=Desulfurella multipotens TaxID=79269 RepID=A0A1G6I618_9BACT|nr:alanine--glyoxylate aminotransferase family protein [Desulfurella multipotens]SDC01944.1 aspartate aminotransferase [Desulfurella multipotens]